MGIPTIQPDWQRQIEDLLTPRQRQICAAFWFDLKSKPQIAEELDICPEAVRLCLRRAKRRLRAAGITPPQRMRQRVVHLHQLSTVAA